jgi:hypothetical protein
MDERVCLRFRATLATVALIIGSAAIGRAGTPLQDSIPPPGNMNASVRDSGVSEAVGTIEGTVRDSDEDSVAEARISLFSETTGESWNPSCDPSGRFKVPGLAPGSYTLKIGATGLRTLSRTGIALQAHQVVHFNVTLKDGEMAGGDSKDDDSEKVSDDDDDGKSSKKKSKRKGHFILRPFKAIGKIIPGDD